MGKEIRDKILIVDDESVIRKWLTFCLEERGLEVICAEDGAQAWQLFERERPALVITDLIMPIMNGYQLLTKIVEIEPDVPVIVVSGKGQKEDVLKALRLGAWNYLEKPFEDMMILQHVVDKALERQKLLALALNYQQLFEKSLKERTLELEQIIREKSIVEKQIERAKKEWERTVDCIPDLIALLDRNHLVIRLNKAMSDALGVDMRDVIGNHYCLFSQDSGQSCKCLHDQVMADGKMHLSEMYDQRSDNYYEVRSVPYIDPDGVTVIGSVVFARNINERKQAEEEAVALQGQLLHAQKLESVGRLAAGIAHEINTPTQYVGTNIDFLSDAFHDVTQIVDCLQGIIKEGKSGSDMSPSLANAEQLLEDVDWEYLAEEVPEAISQSRVGIQKVTSIVQAMKEFSHPGGREKDQEDLNAIIETAVTVSRNEWKYVAEMELDLDENLPQVPCLRDEIGQVILNMIVNAAHAIGSKLGDNPSGDKGLIKVQTVLVEGDAEIRISDSGIGMPAEVQKKIFDPFFTTKEVGRGTGQGLTISHDVIVNKHGGTITVDSTPGRGTTFVLHLPITVCHWPKNEDT